MHLDVWFKKIHLIVGSSLTTALLLVSNTIESRFLELHEDDSSFKDKEQRETGRPYLRVNP